MITNTELITPSDAQKMLETSRGNRKIRATAVEHLAREITDGRWQLTHQGIAINENGQLLDGHHRLHAVILAKKPTLIRVTYGVSDSAYAVTDCGAVRSFSDRSSCDKNTAALLALCASIAFSRRPTNSDAELFWPIVESNRVLIKESSNTQKSLSSTPVRLAISARMVFADDDSAMIMARQYHAMTLLDFASMTVTTGTLVRFLLNRRSFRGDTTPCLGAVYKAFDPKCPTNMKLIRACGASYGELVEAVKKVATLAKEERQ